ncbi:MAG: TetR/AcrR family transcriptional regulator [Vicinamibacterales bacterium]
MSSIPNSATKTDLVTAYRRDQILQAARGRFMAGGLKGTTMNQIAHAAGVAKGTVYTYFTSKDAILNDLLSDDLGRLRETTLPAIAADEPLPDRLRAFFRAEVAFYEQGRDFIELCQLELGREPRRKARRQLGDVFAAQQAAWTVTLIGFGIPEDAAARRARAIVSLAYGLAVQRMRGWLDGDAESDIEAAARLAWKGAVS